MEKYIKSISALNGATATECTRKLKEDPLIDKVYVFAITKTRT